MTNFRINLSDWWHTHTNGEKNWLLAAIAAFCVLVTLLSQWNSSSAVSLAPDDAANSAMEAAHRDDIVQYTQWYVLSVQTAGGQTIEWGFTAPKLAADVESWKNYQLMLVGTSLNSHSSNRSTLPEHDVFFPPGIDSATLPDNTQPNPWLFAMLGIGAVAFGITGKLVAQRSQPTQDQGVRLNC